MAYSEELIKKMVAIHGPGVAKFLQRRNAYHEAKKQKEKDAEEAAKSKDVSKLINTPESNLADAARKSRGIQAAVDKYVENNRDKLIELFLGLPDVEGMNEQGKLKVRKWLNKQLSRGGEFHIELLKHYNDDTESKLGNLRDITEADLRKAGTDLANWRHSVRGTKGKKQELQGYLVANAQEQANPAQKRQGVADMRDEYLADLAQGGEGKVYNPETGKFEKISSDVPSDILPEYLKPIILLMNLFDTSGLAPGSYSPPPSPAEKPPSDGIVQVEVNPNKGVWQRAKIAKRRKARIKEWLDDPIYREAHDSYFSQPRSPLPEDWEKGYPFAIYAPDGSPDIIVFEEDGSLPFSLTKDDADYKKFEPYLYVPPVSDSRMKRRKRAGKGTTHVGGIANAVADDLFRFEG